MRYSKGRSYYWTDYYMLKWNRVCIDFVFHILMVRIISAAAKPKRILEVVPEVAIGINSTNHTIHQYDPNPIHDPKDVDTVTHLIAVPNNQSYAATFMTRLESSTFVLVYFSSHIL